MWNSLKKFIHSSHDRVVVIEDNEPRYVVMTVKEYEALVDGGRRADSAHSINSPQSNSGQAGQASSPQSYSGQAPQADSADSLQKVNSALQEAHELVSGPMSLVEAPPAKQEVLPPAAQGNTYRSGVSIEDLPL